MRNSESNTFPSRLREMRRLTSLSLLTQQLIVRDRNQRVFGLVKRWPDLGGFTRLSLPRLSHPRYGTPVELTGRDGLRPWSTWYGGVLRK